MFCDPVCYMIRDLMVKDSKWKQRLIDLDIQKHLQCLFSRGVLGVPWTIKLTINWQGQSLGDPPVALVRTRDIPLVALEDSRP